MKAQIRLCCWLLFFVISTVFAENNTQTAMQLSQLLDNFTTFQAQFTQQTMNRHGRVLQSSQGTVQLKRPGNFRWETVKPTHQIVITNGKILWIYDVDLAQVSTQSVDNGPMSPATLLSGDVKQLLQAFTVHMTSHRNTVTFRCTPNKPNPTFQSVIMTFDHNQLQRMAIKNNLSQNNVFSFSHIVINQPLSSALFNFTAPAGVDVLH